MKAALAAALTALLLAGCAAAFTPAQLAGGSAFGDVDLSLPGPPTEAQLGGKVAEVSPGVWHVEYTVNSIAWEKHHLQEAWIYYGVQPGSRPVAVRARYLGSHWYWGARRAGHLPMEFAGWSRTLGPFHSTTTPNLYATDWAERGVGGGVEFFRALDEKNAWSDRIHGTWTPASAVIPALRDAVGRKDYESARKILGDKPRPLMGADVALFEEVWETYPPADLSAVERRVAHLGTWTDRLKLYDELKEEGLAWKGRGFAEERRDDIDLKRREVMPHSSKRVLGDAARFERLVQYTLKGTITQAYKEGRVATAAVWDIVSWSRTGFEGGGKQNKAMFVLNTYYPYVIREGAGKWFNEEKGHSYGGKAVDLLIGTPLHDCAANLELTYRRNAERDAWHVRFTPYEILDLTQNDVVIKSRLGAWVPATREQLNTQKNSDALYDRRVADLERIDSALATLWTTPLGTTVKGWPGVKVVQRSFENGKMSDVVIAESPQNTYRIGMSEDAADRRATERRLKEERESLVRALGNGQRPKPAVVDGKVWDPGGGAEVSSSARQYYATVARKAELAGPGLKVWEEQRRNVSGTLYGVAQVGKDMVASELTRYDADHSLTADIYAELLRKAIRETVECQVLSLSASQVRGAEEERGWAYWWLGMGPPPEPELAELVKKAE